MGYYKELGTRRQHRILNPSHPKGKCPLSLSNSNSNSNSNSRHSIRAETPPWRHTVITKGEDRSSICDINHYSQSLPLNKVELDGQGLLCLVCTTLLLSRESRRPFCWLTLSRRGGEEWCSVFILCVVKLNIFSFLLFMGHPSGTQSLLFFALVLYPFPFFLFPVLSVGQCLSLANIAIGNPTQLLMLKKSTSPRVRVVLDMNPDWVRVSIEHGPRDQSKTKTSPKAQGPRPKKKTRRKERENQKGQCWFVFIIFRAHCAKACSCSED